jgi:hypothetical protein
LIAHHLLDPTVDGRRHGLLALLASRVPPQLHQQIVQPLLKAVQFTEQDGRCNSRPKKPMGERGIRSDSTGARL